MTRPGLRQRLGTPQPSPARRAKARVSYAESDWEAEEESDFQPDDRMNFVQGDGRAGRVRSPAGNVPVQTTYYAAEVRIDSPTQGVRTANLPAPDPYERAGQQTRSQGSGMGLQSMKRRRPAKNLERSRTKQKRIATIPEPKQWPGKKMPWQTLPYHVLESIFYFASMPLVVDFRPQKSINLLRGWMLLCRAFAGPAMSVLYSTPPITTASNMQRLLDTLDKWPGNGNRIHHLILEATETLGYRALPFRITEILESTPQVKEIALQMPLEEYKWLTANNPSYLSRFIVSKGLMKPIALAEYMSQKGITLSAWTWDRILENKFPSLDSMCMIHRLSAFQSIRTLNLFCYGLETDAGLLGPAILALPHLRHLNLHRCDALNECLPPGLQSLMISESLIDSDQLQKYLIADGNQLQHLELDHNRCLNLEWLPCLGKACPHLISLELNMLFSSLYASTTDIEPQFSYLLLADQIPTWPATIQRIDFKYLRKWGIAAAETFFHSLATSHVPHLRRLFIKASIDQCGWRERIAFRNSWKHELTRVFLRNPVPPQDCLSSIVAFHSNKSEGPRSSDRIRKDPPILAGRSRRHAVNVEHGDADETGPLRPVQGMCDVVDVTIDNLRPSEEQLHENDFLDQEISGDEDYRGT